MKATRLISVLVALMGLVHIAATFSPLIGGKLAVLDEGTYKAMIYMSLMCGLLLVTLGGYAWWAIKMVACCPQLRPTILATAVLLLIDGALAVTCMPHNPFALTIGILCVIEFLLIFFMKAK